MKIVEALFILNHQENKQESCKTYYEAGNINNGIAFVPGQISESRFEIIFEHDFSFCCQL
jgi:hypothetical protein